MIANYPSGVIVLAALSVIAILSLPAQASHSKTPSDQVDAVVSEAAEEFYKSAPLGVGMSVGVIKDGKTYTYNYGTLEKGKKGPPAADTLYPIASITKTFTGTLLAQAVIEKKVKFDDDVRK